MGGALMVTAFHTVTHQLGSLLINAIDDNGCKWWATIVEGGSSTPPPKMRRTKRPYGLGGYRARSYWDVRRFTIEGGAECPNGLAAEVAADSVRSIFTDGGQVAYTRKSRLGSRFINVELYDALRVTVLPGGYAMTFQIPLEANDPRYLDSTLQTASASVSAPSTSGLDWATGGGLDWATGGGLNWGTPTSTGVMSVVNSGNADAYPLLSIAGPMINPSLTDPATGRSVAYAGQINTGQTLIVDMAPFTRRVTVDSIDRSAALSSAQWITVPPGASRSLVFGGSGIGLATVTMRSAYL
jgi:hypothetical protein